MLGISELQSRNASPLHCACASALKAKLALDVIAEIEAATASTKPARRIIWVKDAVIFGSRGSPAVRRVVDICLCLKDPKWTVMAITPAPMCDVDHPVGPAEGRLAPIPPQNGRALARR
jgi:hypothetical protein